MGRQGRGGGGGRYYSVTLVYATPLLQHLAQSGAYAAVRTYLSVAVFTRQLANCSSLQCS